MSIKNLQLLDNKIIETSLADAATLRKKHQYASAIKAYKTLLTDYTNTPHEAPIKVLLDAAIVEDYNYRAKRALGKHDAGNAKILDDLANSGNAGLHLPSNK